MAHRNQQAPEPSQREPEAQPGERAAARGAHLLIMVLMLLGSAQVVFLLGVEAFRYVEVRRQVTSLEQQVQGLTAESTQLQAIADHASDDHFRETLARLQGYMFPNEIRAVTRVTPGAAPVPAPPQAP